MTQAELIEEFKNNRLWIHISRYDRHLVPDLIELLGNIKFKSGHDLDSRVMDNALNGGEAWFRCEGGVSYNFHYPMTSGNDELSPEIYKNGPIYDIKEIVHEITISESDFEMLFKE